MQDDGATTERDEPSRPEPPPGPMPPLYGTRESAAGLPAGAPQLAGRIAPPTGVLATAGQRFLARMLDIVCVGIVLGVAQLALWLPILRNEPRLRWLFSASATQQATEAQMLVLQQTVMQWAWLSTLVLLVVWFLYEVPSMAVSGRTLGKLAVGVRVTGGTGPRVGWVAAATRWGVLALPMLLNPFGLAFQLLDCGWLLRDKSRPRCLHDRAGKTDVVRAASQPPAN